MKRFLKNTILFFLLYLGLSTLLSFCLPYHWGNPWYSVKIQFLKQESKHEWNTYFFGSSRVHDQIDPKRFDELVNKQTEEEVHSFNLGAQGTFPPQSYFLFENFLESRLSEGVKYCFLEVREVARLLPANRTPPNHSYWMNIKELSFVLPMVLSDSTTSLAYKQTQVIRNLTGYVKNMLHLGHFAAQLTNPNYYDEACLGPEKNGFLPLEYQYETTNDPVLRAALSKKRQLLEEKPENLDRRRHRHLEGHLVDSAVYYSEIHRDRLLRMIESAKGKGIQLILLYISSGPNQAPERAIQLLRSLPKANVIDLADPAKYPELFAVENAFDIGHLNDQGSRIFTTHLANQFISLSTAE